MYWSKGVEIIKVDGREKFRRYMFNKVLKRVIFRNGIY